MPADWKLSTIEKQLCATVDKISALRFRLAYGYVSSIKATDSFDAGSPFCAQVILRLPYRFGVTAHEAQNSWIFCRVNAFASCACLPSSAQAVRVGMPVCGLVAKSSKTYETAQLVARPTATAEDWKLLSRDTFPFMGLELSIRDIYRLPALHRKNFPYPAHPPALDYTLALHPDSLQVDTAHHIEAIPAPRGPPPSMPAPAPASIAWPKRPPPMRKNRLPPSPPTEAYPAPQLT